MSETSIPTAITDLLRRAIGDALGHLYPSNDLERAIVVALTDAAKDPATTRVLVSFVRDMLDSGLAPPSFPEGVSPRASGLLVSAFQRAEADHRKGAADLLAAVLRRIVDGVLAAAL